MTSIKTLAIAGLLLGAAAVSLATPASISLMPSASRTTTATLTIVGSLGTDGSLQLTGANPVFTYDPAKVTVGAFTPAAGTDWTNQGSQNAGGKYQLALTSNNGQPAGVIGTIALTLLGTSPTNLVLTTDSACSDDNYITYNNLAAENAGVFTGAYRNLGGPIAGSPSAGPGGVVAVAAGGSLKLLKASDLTDVAGFNAPAVGPVSGRPAFGVIGTQAVVAVGDDAGKLTIADAGTGAPVAALTLGAKVSTPAIDSTTGTVYAAVTAASGPASLVKVVGGAASPVATLAGSTVLGAPAVFGGGIAVGTDKGVESFRPDGTPQAGVPDSGGATVAPIVGPGGKALSGNASKILGFNVVTGAATTGSVAHGATGISELWYDSASDTVIAGTPSGNLLMVNLTSGAPTIASTKISSLAVPAEPIKLTKTWALDAGGNLVSDAGDSVGLAGPATKALAATGTASGNSIIAATADGGVAAVAF